MKKIIRHLRDYFVSSNKIFLVVATVFTGLLIYINYHFSLNRFINHLDEPWQFTCWYVVFFIAFSFGYLFQKIIWRSTIFSSRKFRALLIIA
ncbi:MAG: hypothetical protein M3Y85_05715, partial [Bacteroidota bacterium]|nr:hypothetical protein [Bacteroidota bacterium]